MFTLQYVSDIHLELSENVPDIPIFSKNLALCGDIGIPGSYHYTNFIYKCSNSFENVFVIFGNHEYYNSPEISYIETMADRESFTHFPPNVFFLNNNSVFVHKKSNKVYSNLPHNSITSNYVKIIGSTLWSDISEFSSLFMNDYNYIFVTPHRKIHYTDVIQMFQTNLNFILTELDNNPDVESILLTHHGTHPVCNKNQLRSKLNSAYISFIPELYVRKNLTASISGHTHSSINESLIFGNNTIKFLSNQYGYPNENKDFSFKKGILSIS